MSILFIFKLIYLFVLLLAALGLCCYAGPGGGVRGGYSLVAGHSLLTVGASLAERGLQSAWASLVVVGELSSCETQV